MTLYDTKLHKIWIVPLDVGGIFASSILKVFSGHRFKDFITDPLVYIRNFGGNLSARNRDLNPIGLKRNLRQHFGSNSNKIILDGYISPMENRGTIFNSLQQGVAVNSTRNKFLFLKTAILNQMKFLILYNNDFEIVTLDVLDYKESATKPYIYDITLQATSIRSYDGLKFYLHELATDVVLNLIVQNLLPTMVI